MRIADISIENVRAGLNWKILDWEDFADSDLPFEELQIEPLGEYDSETGVVYSGLTVHLAGESEPSGETRPRSACTYAPESPAELREGQRAIVRPLLMIKSVSDTGWDYCELSEDGWRQLGLVPDPDAPLTHEYFANALPEDGEFSIELEPRGVTLGAQHREGFMRWAGHLEA